MTRLTREQNRELAAMMLRESYGVRRAREEIHRALPEDEQPPMVIAMGIFDYRVIWVAPCGGSKGEKLAQKEMTWWQAKARRGGLEVLPLSRNFSEHDFQVRTQASLDALTDAILRSYR